MLPTIVGTPTKPSETVPTIVGNIPKPSETVPTIVGSIPEPSETVPTIVGSIPKPYGGVKKRFFTINHSFLTINSPIRTTSASGKAAVSERRRRDVPSGTVGGRTGRT